MREDGDARAAAGPAVSARTCAVRSRSGLEAALQTKQVKLASGSLVGLDSVEVKW